MTRTRLGLLGLCAMVFGLMAFSATAAHAEPGAEWLFSHLLEGKEVLLPFLEAAVNLRTDKNGVLHSKIAGISVLFECEEIAASATLKKGGSASGKINFSK